MRFQREPELAEHLGHPLEVRGPVEVHVRHAQEKVQVLGKAWQPVQNAQTGAALEQGAIEKIGAPQRV